MIKILSSNARGVGLTSGWGAKIPHALQPKNQNIKQKKYCNTFNKDFKFGAYKKVIIIITYLRVEVPFLAVTRNRGFASSFYPSAICINHLTERLISKLLPG